MSINPLTNRGAVAKLLRRDISSVLLLECIAGSRRASKRAVFAMGCPGSSGLPSVRPERGPARAGGRPGGPSSSPGVRTGRCSAGDGRGRWHTQSGARLRPLARSGGLRPEAPPRRAPAQARRGAQWRPLAELPTEFQPLQSHLLKGETHLGSRHLPAETSTCEVKGIHA